MASTASFPSTTIWQSLWRSFVKVVLHIVFGQCELERITKSFPSHRLEMIPKVGSSLRRSKQLPGARNAVSNAVLLDVGAVMDEIMRVKRFSNPGILFCVQSLHRTSVGLVAIAKLATEAFSCDNPSHERMLEDLWCAMRPGVRRHGGRVSEDWTSIGFQSSRPETDFRGGGVLSLENLLYFSRQGDVASRILRELCQDVTRGGFPFAVTGINITWYIFHDLLSSRRLDDLFTFPSTSPPPETVNERTFLLSGEQQADDETTEKLAVERFNVMYSVLFRMFARHWRDARPADAMQFPYVFKAFKKEVEGMITTRQGLDYLSGRLVGGELYE